MQEGQGRTIKRKVRKLRKTMKKDIRTMNSGSEAKSAEQLSKRTFMNSAKNQLIVVLALLVVAASGAAIYFYKQFQQGSDEQVQQEVDVLVARVGKLLVLPEGEQPTVATVSDIDKLRDQPFFTNAKNGDKVLIYTNARRVVLYDPVANKIVDVAPLNIGNSGEIPSSPEPAPESTGGQ